MLDWDVDVCLCCLVLPSVGEARTSQRFNIFSAELWVQWMLYDGRSGIFIWTFRKVNQHHLLKDDEQKQLKESRFVLPLW